MHGDHLGSTSVASTNTGAFHSRQTYYAFGVPRTTEGTLPTDYTFTGQKNDSSDALHFYNARYYDAAIGRFTQPDTIIPDQFNPQSLNRYSYVRNNPVRYTDPTGHWECEDEDCEKGKGGPKPPAQKYSTEELVEKYRQALQEIKAACQQNLPTCYMDSWWWIDPMSTRDDITLVKIIEQARKAYRTQGLDINQIVAANRNNPLNPLLVKPADYPDLIVLWYTAMMPDPVAGFYLRMLNLDDSKQFYSVNREPLFWILHVVKDPVLLYRTAQDCARAGLCVDYH